MGIFVKCHAHGSCLGWLDYTVCFSPHAPPGVYVIRIVIEIPLDSDIFAGVGPRQNDQDQERVDNFVNQVQK